MVNSSETGKGTPQLLDELVKNKTKRPGRPKKQDTLSGGLKFTRRFTQAGKDPLDEVEYEFRSAKIINPDGTTVFEMNDAEVPKAWSRVATDVVISKYFRKAGVPQYDAEGNAMKNPDGNPKLGPEHSIKQAIRRLVGTWRYWGERYNYFDSKESAQIFEDEAKYMIVHQVASPNSPQWFNTGLNWAYGLTGPAQGHSYVDPDTGELKKSTDAYTRPQPHACFIQSVKDDLVNEGGIMDLVTREARVFKYGSGSGTNFSDLRGEGEPLSGGGTSSGLMSWLKIFDRAAGAIKSGGTTRRAAKMVCVDIDHPDVEKFATWKANEEKKVAALIEAGYSPDFNGEAYQTVSGQNSNNSIRITKDFFKALENNEDWALRWRTDRNHIAKTIPAKELWNKISDSAWISADPGVQYDTTINEWHTCSNSGPIKASNPCSEYMFLDDSACNLASLNLLTFYNEKTNEFKTTDFSHSVRIWTFVLEISVLMAQFVSDQMALNSYKFRPLGLGFANLGTLLMVMGLPYDSDEARSIGGGIAALMTGEAYATSAEMAKGLGAFEGYTKNRKPMMKVIANHRRAAYNAPKGEYEGLSVKPHGLDQKLTPTYLLEAAHDAWDRALLDGGQYGFRNAQVTGIAPTGTIGLGMDCDTTGVEPDFALVKFKKLSGGGYFKIVNQSVPLALKTLGYSKPEIDDIIKYTVGSASLIDSPEINRENLAEKGFSVQDLNKIEEQLKGAFELRFAFNPSIISPQTLDRIGLSPESWSDPGFDPLSTLGFTESQIEKANEAICGAMTVEGAPHLKPEHLAVFDCANRCGKKGERLIQADGHLFMMASVQPFISGAISKTINLPSEAIVDEVSDIYLKGWKLGIKAVALYRDGSKLSQPLQAKGDKKKSDPEVIVEKVIEYKPLRKKPPKERQSITRKFEIGGHELYLTVGLYPDGKPAEIFINMAQEGSFASGMADAFAKMSSIGLQYGVPLETIVHHLRHMRFEPMGFTGDSDIPNASSVADFIAQWLDKTFLGTGAKNMTLPFNGHADAGAEEPKEIDGVSKTHIVPVIDDSLPEALLAKPAATLNLTDGIGLVTGSSCPECGSSTMVRNGSCLKCLNCGATTGCS